MLDLNIENQVNELLSVSMKDVIEKVRSESTEPEIRRTWESVKLAEKLENILLNIENDYKEKYKDILSKDNYVVYTEKRLKPFTVDEYEYIPSEDCIDKDNIDLDTVDEFGNPVINIKEECKELISQGLAIPSLDLYREEIIENFFNNLEKYKKDLDYTEYINLVKEEAIKVVDDEFSKALDLITDKYPEHERLTWPQQKEEALAYKQDPNTNTPLLDNIAEARNVPKNILADKIIEKATAYETISGKAVGYRQLAEDMLNKVTAIDELNNVIETLRGFKNKFYEILNNA